MNTEIARINQGVTEHPEEYVRTVNKEYLYKLRQIAGDIASQRSEKPVILLSGPSGSGKTTTAMMISNILGDMGVVTHTLSMDNYFRSLTEDEKKLAAHGRFDLESPARIDGELLNKQIESISACKEIEIPRYNFIKSAREDEGKKFRRNPQELVIFEGIHALNPDVITVPDSHICKIYVSVRTRITDGVTVLHPSRIRLMRRMIRDGKFRHRTLRETMNMFQSVEDGENKYIMPYKHRSDYDVDTFMAYEPAVYKPFLMEGLRELSDFSEIREMISLMEQTDALDESYIPEDSLIREFIGNGQYKY